MKKTIITITVIIVIFLIIKPSPNSSKYVYLGGLLPKKNSLSALQKTQSSPHIIGIHIDWETPIPSKLNPTILSKNAIPLIIWEPQLWSDPLAMTLESIPNGDWDELLIDWANHVKAFEYPIFISFAPQVNHQHYPWHLTETNTSASTYIKAYQYIVNFFKKHGAFNVYWVWEITAQPSPNTAWNHYQRAYPGDDYVDWICIYGKNEGNNQQWTQWKDLETIIKSTLIDIQENYNKPIAIRTETSTKGGNAQKWLSHIPIQLESTLSSVQLLLLPIQSTLSINKHPIFQANLDAIQEVTHVKPSPIPYNDTNPIKLNLPQHISKSGYYWKGNDDFSATVQFKYVDKAFYITIICRDDYPHTNLKNRDNIILGDSIELISNNTHFGLNTKNSTQLWNFKTHRTHPNTMITYETIDSHNYKITIILPKEQLTSSKNIQFIFNDVDPEGETQAILTLTPIQ